MHPLEGVRVLDFSRVVAGPFCTMQLADLGADVLKVEHPEHGDETRAMKPPDAGGEAHYYLAVNRSKRSVALDITTADGREVVLALLARSDVLVENFRPGVMGKLGLDYASLRDRYPRLVYCSVSAYGQVGPMAERPGFDPVVQAESGMMSMTGEAGGDPLRHPLAIVDTFTALYATSAILAAIVARASTGRGQHIDLALFDCGIAVLLNAAEFYLTSGRDPVQMGNTHPTVTPVGLFKTRTGPFYLACGNDRLFRQLCHGVLERLDISDDPRFATNPGRVTHRDELIPRLQEIFSRESCEHWLPRLRAAGVPAGAVRTVSQALESEEVQARGMVRTVAHPTAGALRLVGSPHKLSGTPVTVPAPPPLLGQHTDEVLREVAGLDAARLAALRASKTIR